MSDGTLLFLALIVSVAGMGFLALSIGSHWRQLFATHNLEHGTTLSLRVVGALLLAGSFLLCALADPVSMAALVWPMLLTVSAAIVAGSLSVHAHLARGRSATDLVKSNES